MRFRERFSHADALLTSLVGVRSQTHNCAR